MTLADMVAEWRAEAPVLAGSAVVVLVMIGVAYALGFRAKAKLTEAELTRLADGELVEAAVIAPDGRAAFAKLSGGKIMVARAMGADVSVRIAPASTVRVALTRGRLSAAFADSGYPPLHMKLDEAPPWLVEMAAGKEAAHA